MSEHEMYTEEQLSVDMKRQTEFFRDLLNKDIARIRYNIITDYRMPREGWETPYQNIIHISRNAGRSTAALSESLESALESLRRLNALAEKEMVDLQIHMGCIFDAMENVR